MKACDVVTHMVRGSGKSARDVSREMGRHYQFITNTVTRKSVPKLDTFVKIAVACGYEVVLRGHGEEVTIKYE